MEQITEGQAKSILEKNKVSVFYIRYSAGINDTGDWGQHYKCYFVKSDAEAELQRLKDLNIANQGFTFEMKIDKFEYVG